MAKSNIFSSLKKDELKKLKKIKQPQFINPMLATLTSEYFSSKDWIYEHKFDGERCIAVKKNGKVKLFSRNKNIKNKGYPELVQALEKQQADNFIIDGEIVATGKHGISDFQLLQSRINLKDLASIKEREKKIRISYYIFDIIYLDGYNLQYLPLLARKKILKKFLKYNKILKYTDHKSPDGIKYFKQACKLHWEGLIAKKANSIYVNKRSKNWLKFKCAAGQELVIGGFTKPKGSRTDFGALLIGYYDKNKNLIYAGKVGTGFSHEILKMLGKKLRDLKTNNNPFTNYDDSTNGVLWVKPKLVAEFKFAQWTNSGKLRVGRYQGLRDDKKATNVVRESA